MDVGANRVLSMSKHTHLCMCLFIHAYFLGVKKTFSLTEDGLDTQTLRLSDTEVNVRDPMSAATYEVRVSQHNH